SGTRGAPVYELEEGRVLFSVTPEQGIHLKVRTEEAEVEVLGTVFEVKRTALGTEVSVERGKVLVSCKDPGREPQSIIEGQTVTCLPVTGTAWFNRANALGEGGDREHYAAAIDAALAAGVEPYQRAELLGKRMALNVERRQELSALADAKAYLETGETVRRRSALNVAALYSYSLEGSCEAAAPYIELMTTEGVALDPQLLAACPQ
ncbi:MAG: FecR domain-containing protein, partial [Alphaproteobacteria bacterium]|nr:FecR domain-containing protein [Alphaproteobacteria bacterium]